ncbi:carboxylate--amine ligase [Enterococcus alishanensis]|uniref:Carboxylate--amine ligase n=1 Tax=Enterococcus alishanensis TaxID=1303817 RepID=A0ABS6TBT9_9ENTE|nr:carboxylate--amine ligase [Enterococcus alishanensis]MBV7390376.1 carboxylate--amine ligase [Enterococcus alishanensis]
MNKQQKFVPILLGSDINVYGMARSFHEAYGIHVEAYAGLQLAPTKYSKIVTIHTISGFAKDPVFIEEMRRLAKEKYNDSNTRYLLIACGDGYAELISQHKDELSQWYVCPYIEFSLLERLMSKVSFYDICEEYHLPYPKTFIITKDMLEDGLLTQALPFDFPVALKPADSVEWLSVDFEGRKKAFIFDNRDEFDVILKRIYENGYTSEMIAQDFIPGDDSNMRVLNAYVDQNHNVRMMCLGHPLLEDPSPEAVGNYVAILPEYNEKIYQTIKSFLEKINYTGFANFDMKYDSRDGEYKLFEINLRQGRSSFFVVLNGFNLAQYVTEDRIFEIPFQQTDYGMAEPDKAVLWMGVPNDVFTKYAKNNEDKKLAEKLLKDNRWGTTVFYKEDMGLRRWVLMKYMFYKYKGRFDEFFKEKEG